MKRRVGMYLRVSVDTQHTGSQLSALEKYAASREFEIVEVYEDQGFSGAKEKRPALDRLMADARRRKFDAVLVFRVDRFSRSLKHLVLALEEFKALGIDFISYSESWDTTSPMGEAMFQLSGIFAQLERSIIRERIIAGIRRAREKGRRLGRKPVDVSAGEVKELRASGKSIRAIASAVGCGKSTVAAMLKRHGNPSENSGRGEGKDK